MAQAAGKRRHTRLRTLSDTKNTTGFRLPDSPLPKRKASMMDEVLNDGFLKAHTRHPSLPVPVHKSHYNEMSTVNESSMLSDDNSEVFEDSTKSDKIPKRYRLRRHKSKHASISEGNADGQAHLEKENALQETSLTECQLEAETSTMYDDRHYVMSLALGWPEQDESFLKFIRPADIPDKDKELKETDGLHSLDHSMDMVWYMRHLEKKSQPMGRVRNTALTSKIRAELMDWVIQVQHHMDLQQVTMYAAVNTIERMVREIHISGSDYQLLAITAILIASKVYERYAASVAQLVYLTDHSCQYDDVLSTELLVLQTLGGWVTPGHPDFFIQRFISIAISDLPDNKNFYLVLGRFYLDCSVAHGVWCSALPSKLAAAATCMVGLATSKFQWDPMLEFYTGYMETELEEIMRELAINVIHAETSKYKGAFSKYSSRSRYDAVALNFGILGNVMP